MISHNGGSTAARSHDTAPVDDGRNMQRKIPAALSFRFSRVFQSRAGVTSLFTSTTSSARVAASRVESSMPPKPCVSFFFAEERGETMFGWRFVEKRPQGVAPSPAHPRECATSCWDQSSLPKHCQPLLGLVNKPAIPLSSLASSRHPDSSCLLGWCHGIAGVCIFLDSLQAAGVCLGRNNVQPAGLSQQLLLQAHLRVPSHCAMYLVPGGNVGNECADHAAALGASEARATAPSSVQYFQSCEELQRPCGYSTEAA